MECSKCGHEKPHQAFATYRNRAGELRRRGICQICRDQYAKDNFTRLQVWRQTYNLENRTKKQIRDYAVRAETKAWVDQLKSTTPCADCGGNFHPVAMDFDHIGPKLGNIASMVSSGYKLPLIQAEIAKCQIVCANCHRIRTHLRKQNSTPRTESGAAQTD